MNKITIIFVFLFVISTTATYAQSTGANSATLIRDKDTNCQLRYYYYPNLQAYFDLLKNVFYYQENGNWYRNEVLPKNYGGYSLYKMYRVLITDFDDDEPFTQLKIHKKLYPYNYKGAKK